MRRLRRFAIPWGFAIGVAAFAANSERASAQGYGAGTVYVPYGGGSGGFLPYSPGPGGGLGVQSRANGPMGRGPSAGDSPGMFSGGGSTMASGLGALRTSLPTLTPIRASGPSMGMGGGLINRPAGGGGMNAMGRPMVGSYPFRQPQSLSGLGIGMGM